MPDRPRDSQRKKLYTWERNLFSGRDTCAMSLLECKELIDRVFTDHGATPPQIGDGRGRRHAGYAPAGFGFSIRHRRYRKTDPVIKLPRWARKRWIVLHESAHGLVDNQYGISVAGHGPEFVKTYINLLAIYMGHDREHLHDSARQSGLKAA